MNKRVMCVWLPNWPIQRREHDRRRGCRPLEEHEEESSIAPRGRGASLELIVHHDPRSRTGLPGAGRPGQRVFARSAALAKAGVRVGMPVAEAMALLPRSRPFSLACEPHDPVEDRSALEQLARWCQRYTPLVGIEEAETPDGVFLDVTGCVDLFGGGPSLLRQVREELAREGWKARVVLADNLGLAWGVARHGPLTEGGWDGLGDEALAPPGERHIPQGGSAEALDPLSPRALRLPPSTTQMLSELGIRTIADLRRLPKNELAARLGREIGWRLGQSAGRVPEIVIPTRSLPFVEVDKAFEDPVTRHDLFRGELERRLEELARCLPPHHGLQRLTCRLGHGNRRESQWSVEFYRASGSPAHWLSLMSLRLERAVLPGPVETLRLQGTALSLLESRQETLFNDAPARQESALAGLLDRLCSRLGKEAVSRVAPRAEALPERAHAYHPVISLSRRPGEGRRRAPGGKRSKENEPGSFNGWEGSRPIFLASPPIPIEVLASHPGGRPLHLAIPSQKESTASRRADPRAAPPLGPSPRNGSPSARPSIDAVPSERSLKSLEGPLQRVWGPERIETGWWRGPMVRRDYFRAQTNGGRHVWIFRQLDQGSWFLHGWF